MAQIRGGGYGQSFGQNNPSFGAQSSQASNDPSPLDAIREQTSKIEDALDTLSDPIKPYVAIPPKSTRPRPGDFIEMCLFTDTDPRGDLYTDRSFWLILVFT